jgi:hypothetical protein
VKCLKVHIQDQKWRACKQKLGGDLTTVISCTSES